MFLRSSAYLSMTHSGVLDAIPCASAKDAERVAGVRKRPNVNGPSHWDEGPIALLESARQLGITVKGSCTLIAKVLYAQIASRRHSLVSSSSTAHPKIVSAYPRLVVGAVISSSRHAEMLCDIHVALSTYGTCLCEVLNVAKVNLPWTSAVDAFDSTPALRRCPLVETGFMHIVAASSFAPDQFVVLSVKVEVTDWAFPFAWLSAAIGVT